jgi:TolB-like protein
VKPKLLAIIFGCFLSMMLSALPKVAVLDAILPEKMDKDVAIGITEKISEQLVRSGKFTVLDRTTVGQSLKEIEFQLSGLVSDAEIRRAGEQLGTRLGASFVVVARVSLVTGTYFISAKMIDIKTGEITAQASDEEEGKASVTLKIAQRVGKDLVGEETGTEIVEQPKESASQPAAAAESQAAPSVKAPETVVIKDTLSDGDRLPEASIKIDGNFDDWNGILPAFSHAGQAEKMNLAIDKVYLAVDEKHLYMRLDIMDVTPSSFFHPNNFNTSFSSSYGLDLVYGMNHVIPEVRFDANPQVLRFIVQIARIDRGHWELIKNISGNYAMKGPSLEAAFPLEPIEAV